MHSEVKEFIEAYYIKKFNKFDDAVYQLLGTVAGETLQETARRTKKLLYDPPIDEDVSIASLKQRMPDEVLQIRQEILHCSVYAKLIELDY